LSLRTKILAGIVFVVLLSYILVFTIPKPVTFAYSGDECVQHLTLLPGVVQQSTDSGFDVSYKDSWVVGGAQLASMSICFTPNEIPTVGDHTVRVAPFASIFASKPFKIMVPEAATANSGDFIGKTLPLTRPVTIDLSKEDETFSYKYSVQEKGATCTHKDKQLLCDISKLGLEQGRTYPVQLDRYFKATKVATLAKGEMTTLRPLALVSSSVTEGQVVYDKPKSIVLTYDKEMASATAQLTVREGEAKVAVPVKTTTEGKTVIITPTAELKRNATFDLAVQKAEGDDGSSLAAPQALAFSTSGGPKVTGISVGTSGAPVSGTIRLTFDQEMANADLIPKLVTVKGIDARVTKNGTTLNISYSGAKCAPYTITVAKGFTSAAGITQTDDWTFSGRTQCYTLQSIGISKNGRSILAYVFGSGSKTILYTGTIHGNEYSARSLMNAWVDEIEAHPQNIPANTQLIVIPSVNPDGAAAGTRTNANNVDLNRNFNVSDWKSDIQTVGGNPFPGGGGSAPESEPETKALAAYTRNVAPSLTMSYHAAAAYVIANTCGDSGSLASTYASMVGYRNMTGVSGAFAYEITGTYDDWICEKLGRRSVLVELTTNTNSEFSRHKAALWLMAKS